MKHLFFLLSQNFGIPKIDLCLLEGVLLAGTHLGYKVGKFLNSF